VRIREKRECCEIIVSYQKNVQKTCKTCRFSAKNGLPGRFLPPYMLPHIFYSPTYTAWTPQDGSSNQSVARSSRAGGIFIFLDDFESPRRGRCQSVARSSRAGGIFIFLDDFESLGRGRCQSVARLPLPGTGESRRGHYCCLNIMISYKAYKSGIVAPGYSAFASDKTCAAKYRYFPIFFLNVKARRIVCVRVCVVSLKSTS